MRRPCVYVTITEITTEPTKLTEETTFEFQASIRTIFLAKGKYRLKCYGAQGNILDSSNVGGKGGYAAGEIDLTADTFLHLVTGQQGSTVSAFNGGVGGGGGTQNICQGGGGSSFLGTLENAETLVGLNTGNGHITITPLNKVKPKGSAQII